MISPHCNRPLTEKEIIARAEAKARDYRRFDLWAAAMATATVFVAITEPIHGWIYVHLQFFFAMFCGAALEAIAWGIWRWRRGDKPKGKP